MDIKGQNILVVGLARTGVAVARFLAGRGARVTVTDLRDESALAGSLEQLAGVPVSYVLGRHDEVDFAAADMVVVSPGVPQESPFLQAARRAGREVITEIELASRFITVPMVAITGTNGKTTTTTIAGEIFTACGFRTFVGGNIGNPLIELVEGDGVVERVVVEISSFQLEWISQFRPKVAVLLNITEDHLDRYATFQEYIDAKARIFENQDTTDWAVLNMDDPIVAGLAGRIDATIFPMSQRQELAEGIFHRDGVITFRHAGREERFPTERFRITGVHNTENIMASLAAALLLGCDPARALAAVEEFGGLPHRMELVRELDGVRYYEDSKATNVGSVEKALASFTDITLIAGGKDKGGSYAPLTDLVRERVRYMILIGEAKERMAGELGHLSDTRMAVTLEEAVELAARLTAPGGVVLFSPACSSFDMFRDYEERAARFRAAVNALGQGGAA
ncbi:MAG: UDP-N-acetylmuramoyl-L-alanine--D-glutamate ligase [Desulfuromonadales bacterium]|nr:MAG: UDP-N-acetylmuramoyl-L-alanine--D-glutamate ligase [Desulfuromonadales bacterium]